jgi:preprotein translocase subunit SecD
MPTLRWKVLTVVAVLLVFGTVGVYPIVASRSAPQPRVAADRGLKLGLDLKGGVHLVLRVQTDDALNLETVTEMERLRELLSRTPFRSQHSQVEPDPVQGRRHPDAQDAAFRQPRPKSKRTSIGAPASAAPTPSR